ncbi:hypothetical protein [Amycolatopsis anabasis]|uniref:hypothetical protein n=1 Tax=Amycolatopsis anabasis TaxID=1840409 RepID=UPI00131CE1F5|nr:hypothetical protein [Amycolatopsis anabasis]
MPPKNQMDSRVAALEARLAALEHDRTVLDQVHRRAVTIDLNLTRLLRHFKLLGASDKAVDQALSGDRRPRSAPRSPRRAAKRD